MAKDLVERKEETGVSTSLFGTGNFLADTLGQNFKQVKEAAVKYKVEDIERRMKRTIQDDIVDLRRKFRQPQDDLLKIIPSTPLGQMNLSDIDDKEFVSGMEKWRIECHRDAQIILSNIGLYKSMFGKEWEDEEEKEFVKSLIIDFNAI